MKQIVSLVVVIALILSSFCSSAFGEYSEKISFRDIPFGTSFEETFEMLKENGVEIEESRDNISQYANEFTVPIKDRVSVAGYEMRITLYFADLKSEEDNWNPEESVIYKAQYDIHNDNWVRIPDMTGEAGKALVITKWYNDFVDKSNDLLHTLELLYGQSKLENGSYGSFNPSNPTYVYRNYSWNGADDTLLKMNCSFYKDGSYGIQIIYTDTNIEGIVNAQMTAIREKENAIREAERAKKQAEEDKKKIEAANGL